MEKRAEELLKDARQHLLKARLLIKEKPIEEYIKLLVFSFYVYYRSSDKLIPKERREFKELFDTALNLVNLDQRVKNVMPESLIYDTGNELSVINILKTLPGLLSATDTSQKAVAATEVIKAKSEKLSKALNMIQKSRFDGALNQLTELSCQFPDDYELHKAMSWKLFEVKHIECITFLEKTVKLNPEDAESFGALGQVLRKVKKFEEAIQAHLRSVALDPTNVTYQFNLARTYIEDRQWNPAREILQKILELDPEMVPAQQALKFVSSSLRGA